MIESAAVRKLLTLLYLAGGLVLADQAADLLATLLANSPSPGAASWRFGAFGLLVSRASVMLVADVMFFTAAIGLGQRGVLRALGVIHLVLTAAVLGGVAVFALDWLQVRGRVNPAGKGSFDLAALRAAVMAVLSLAMLCWAGIAAIRATRTKGPGKGSRQDQSPLLTHIRQDEIPT